jgi:flagellar protein FlaG
MISAGRSVGDFVQTFPAVTALERPSPAAPQRAETASAGASKPVTAAEARQEKPGKEPAQEVAFANSIAELLDQKVSFHFDERINQIVVKVTRGDSDEVIRQMPTEEMIKLMAKFRQDFRGLIFDRTG